MAKQPSTRNRFRLAAILAAVAAALAVTAALILPPLIRAEIVQRARDRGVDLDPGSISIRWGAARMRGPSFSLLGVRGLTGKAASATVVLDGLSPTRVDVEDLSLALTGLDVAPELAAWSAEHGSRAHDLPLSARGVRAAFRERADAPELAALVADGLSTHRSGGALHGARALAAGREIARTEVAWSFGLNGLSLGFGAADPAAAPLTASAAPRPAPLRIDLGLPPAPAVAARFAPTPIAAITDPLGLDLRAPGVTASGSVELMTLAEGTASLMLAGYVPPHPKELDGILFGSTTAVNAKALLSPDRRRLTISELEVAAGALRLRGSGSIQIEGADASITADLKGSIPCSQLAASAVAAHLGESLGRLAGDLGRKALGGTVAVRIQVSALASRLAAARIEPTATVRCRLGG